MTFVSVVVPVFDSEATVRILYEECRAELSRLDDVTDFEFVFVDDGSRDRSWAAIEELGMTDGRVRGARLSRNFGQHHALSAGLDLCRGDWVITMDADLQDEPADLGKLWAIARKGGVDVVNARRIGRRDPVWKRMSSWAFHVVFEWLAGLSYDRRVANYRMMRREVVAALRQMREQSPSIGAQIQWLGFRTVYVDVQHRDRRAGRSTYDVRRLFRLAVSTAIAFSNKPLRLSIGLGLSIASLAALASIWVATRALFSGIPVEGWASLMVSIWFIGGIVIANLGVLGIYLGRVYDEAKGRPTYVVAERLNL